MFVEGNFSNFKTNLTVNRQLLIIYDVSDRKTALLIQISTQSGAITSQSDKETVRKLKIIGHYRYQLPNH